MGYISIEFEQLKTTYPSQGFFVLFGNWLNSERICSVQWGYVLCPLQVSGRPNLSPDQTQLRVFCSANNWRSPLRLLSYFSCHGVTETPPRAPSEALSPSLPPLHMEFLPVSILVPPSLKLSWFAPSRHAANLNVLVSTKWIHIWLPVIVCKQISPQLISAYRSSV